MSTVPLTPGVYRQPLAPTGASGRLARGDIPALLGYAVRGPVGVAVRIYGMEQFEQVFGPRPGRGHLWDAAKGFFETGGRTAYVLRVATDAARAARATLPGDGPLAWRAEASFPWAMIDPRRVTGINQQEAAGWVQVFEEQLRREGERSADPGPWGNGLALQVHRTSLAQTRTLPEELERGPVSLAASLAGIEQHSVLELTQVSEAGEFRRVLVLPEFVDPERSLLHWGSEQATMPCQLHLPMRISSVEFSVQVLRDGVPAQRFEALAPHPGHSRGLASTLRAECRDLQLLAVPRRRVGESWVELEGPAAAAALDRVNWADPATWPAEGETALGGGTSGLEDIAAAQWLQALAEVARLPDAALVACPDLVLRAAVDEPAAFPPDRGPDCLDLSERPSARLSGQVVGIDADGTAHPLAGVQVQAAGTGRQTRTAADGGFTLLRVPDTVLLLRLRHPGYAPLDVPAQASPFASAVPVQLSLSRLAQPRPLPPEEVLQVQRGMADSHLVGDYRVALLDAPRPDAGIDELLGWRARLGELPRGFLTVPWLVLAQQGAAHSCPPCGHVAGVFAAAELAGGIHQSGANRQLRHVQGVSTVIDDEVQALLNPLGLNPMRAFPGRGLRLHGTRSLSADPQWRFITVRRLLDAIEKSLLRLLQPVVFEPNNELLWHCATTTVEAFLGRLYRQGMLAGDSTAASFTVRCDEQVNPPASRDAGILVIEVGVAPTVPYEFITFRIGHAFDALTITEEG